MNSKLREILESVVDWAESGRTSMGRLNALEPDQAEKAIRQAVGEELLAMFPPMWVITEQPDEYARQKALGYNQGLAELRQKIKQWQGGKNE